MQPGCLTQVMFCFVRFNFQFHVVTVLVLWNGARQTRNTQLGLKEDHILAKDL